MGDGFGGGVALGGLEDWKGAGEDGVDEVVEEGLLLESRWFIAGGCSCKAGKVTCEKTTKGKEQFPSVSAGHRQREVVPRLDRGIAFLSKHLELCTAPVLQGENVTYPSLAK